MWAFKNGNETHGEYTQRVKDRGDDEEEPPAEEDGQPVAKKLELIWQSRSNIVESAKRINAAPTDLLSVE